MLEGVKGFGGGNQETTLQFPSKHLLSFKLHETGSKGLRER